MRRFIFGAMGSACLLMAAWNIRALTEPHGDMGGYLLAVSIVICIVVGIAQLRIAKDS